eukprot:scaffold61551_cov61-Phaeocystis_antarctica.AAC.1
MSRRAYERMPSPCASPSGCQPPVFWLLPLAWFQYLPSSTISQTLPSQQNTCSQSSTASAAESGARRDLSAGSSYSFTLCSSYFQNNVPRAIGAVAKRPRPAMGLSLSSYGTCIACAWLSLLLDFLLDTPSCRIRLTQNSAASEFLSSRPFAVARTACFGQSMNKVAPQGGVNETNAVAKATPLPPRRRHQHRMRLPHAVISFPDGLISIGDRAFEGASFQKAF